MVKRDANWGLRRARKNGLRVVEPKRNELQIDIDGSAELAIFRQQWSILEKAGITKTWAFSISPSKRPGKFHVTVTIQGCDITNINRVCLQAILGSDIRREAFNLCRVLNGNKYPIVFFERAK